jgi:hypothetical protein
MSPKAFLFPPAIVAPALLGLLSIYLAVTVTRWALLSLPFIYLGSVCASPNLNLADGCLVVVASVLGLVVLAVEKPAGLAILVSSLASWLFSSIEKIFRGRWI